MRIEKLTINGVEEPMPLATESSPDNIELKRSFRVMGFSRGIAEKHEVEIKDGELVELVFDDDTTWYCNGNTIDQVFPEATVQTRGMDGFEIPVQLRADGAE
ncbi:MAG TPA: hypothetical protein VNS32_28405, partial [Flavisolibacter sp.]|nr:hypothetical protein [Flavisolibacter sp.]